MKLGYFLFEHVTLDTKVRLVKNETDDVSDDENIVLFKGKMNDDEWFKLTTIYGEETIKYFYMDIDEVHILI